MVYFCILTLYKLASLSNSTASALPLCISHLSSQERHERCLLCIVGSIHYRWLGTPRVHHTLWRVDFVNVVCVYIVIAMMCATRKHKTRPAVHIAGARNVYYAFCFGWISRTMLFHWVNGRAHRCAPKTGFGLQIGLLLWSI